VKQLTPAQVHVFLEMRDDFAEAVGRQLGSIQEQQRQLPQNIARGITRHYDVRFRRLQDGLCVVLKDKREKFSQCGTLGDLQAKQRRRARTPLQLFFLPARPLTSHFSWRIEMTSARKMN